MRKIKKKKSGPFCSCCCECWCLVFALAHEGTKEQTNGNEKTESEISEWAKKMKQRRAEGDALKSGGK